MLFHGSLCQGHLPPLGSFTLILTQRCNSVSSNPGSLPNLTPMPAGFGCPVSVFPWSLRYLHRNIYYPIVRCFLSSYTVRFLKATVLSYRKPRKLAQCLVYTTLNAECWVIAQINHKKIWTGMKIRKNDIIFVSSSHRLFFFLGHNAINEANQWLPVDYNFSNHFPEE